MLYKIHIESQKRNLVSNSQLFSSTMKIMHFSGHKVYLFHNSSSLSLSAHLHRIYLHFMFLQSV